MIRGERAPAARAPRSAPARPARSGFSAAPTYGAAIMALFFCFLLGIANFALHRAVLDSGHPVLAQVGWLFRSLGGRGSLVAEFVLLTGTMLLVARGTSAWAWGYAVYSASNALSAWLILNGKV